MKTLLRILKRMGIITLVMVVTLSAIGQNNKDYITVSGNLKDARTKQNLFFAYVTVPGTHVGTVTNSEGDFTLKISNALDAKEIEFSHLGYESKKLPVGNLKNQFNNIALNPSSVAIDEVTVRPEDPRRIVIESFKRAPQNYSDQANMLTGFYRETILQRRNYIAISEAVLDIYKAPYTLISGGDRVKIFKGRKSENVKRADTLAVKLQGGPSVSLLLDIVKNPDLIFVDKTFDKYNFELEDVVMIDNRINYVIHFAQKKHILMPLYYGRLYIDTETLAITNAQFSLNLDNRSEAEKLFVLRKPRGVRFRPTSTSYYVSYTEHNGTYYLNYMRNELAFRANWRRRIFSTSYTVTSEMAITDRDTKNITRFPYRETFKTRDALADAVVAFNDDDFWGEHNYIKPEESIEEAIARYGKRLKRDFE